jgi:agmatine deiminase
MLAHPARLGYRMPAEWEPHAATWLAWPHYEGDWPGKFEPIVWVYAEIIRNLARHERVELIVQNSTVARQAQRILERADSWSDNIRMHRWPTNRVWLRDSGCIFLKYGSLPGEKPLADHLQAAARYLIGMGQELIHTEQRGQVQKPPPVIERSRKKKDSSGEATVALKFRFNAWAKYSNWRLDEKIGSLMAHAANAQEVRPVAMDERIVLEGGSIDVNGYGAILTTEECLLTKEQQRNPHMVRAHYEKAFADYLAAPNTIWLGRGIEGDDTHGHVDDLARFVSKSTVVTMVEPNSKDVNHAPLRANLRRLQAACDQEGKPLNVVEIPMPQPVVFEGRRLPASYANFYIANGLVLAPVFNRPNDRIALDTLAHLFPGREIIPIYSGDFIWGLGAMHCMTQQQPA